MLHLSVTGLCRKQEEEKYYCHCYTINNAVVSKREDRIDVIEAIKSHGNVSQVRKSVSKLSLG